MFGANRLNIVVKARKGTIWNKEALTRLYEVTQAVMFLPNVDRLGVQSLWTPNSLRERDHGGGVPRRPVIDSTVTPEELTPETICRDPAAANQGGFVGTLVSTTRPAP